MTIDEMVDDLRRQSLADLRLRYDGHNRRPIQASLRRLGQRRRRRIGRVHLQRTLFYWN